MPFQLAHGNIVDFHVDAIVNAANNTLLGGGGVDGAIHRAAGKELLQECMTLGGCETGKAKITKGYNLPAKFVIHTVGPIWRDGKHNEEVLLASCYRTSLELAVAHGCRSIAFPLISSGAYRFPYQKAQEIAVSTIKAFLQNQEEELEVTLVIFDRQKYVVPSKLLQAIDKFLKENSIENAISFSLGAAVCASSFGIVGALSTPVSKIFNVFKEKTVQEIRKEINAVIEKPDESFSQMLLRKIKELGITEVQCYKKANIDRKLFSKIRSNIDYRPKKETVFSFAIALELDLEETNELLTKAGFAFCPSEKFDMILKYFITNKIYDIDKINEILFAYDLKLLGIPQEARLTA